MPLRIILVDDHEVVRIGLKTLLARQPQFEIVDEASGAGEAVEKTLRLKPDVVVMDIRLPGKSGIETCREIAARQPATKVLMLTSYTEDEMLFDAIAAGASGYVLKQIGSGELVRALEAVGRGESLAVCRRGLAERVLTDPIEPKFFNNLCHNGLPSSFPARGNAAGI
jgi:two-component system, NarL family, response regulator DevR